MNTALLNQELKNLLDAYAEVDEEVLWSNLEYFLKKVVPVAEKSGVNMGIHPDDPPWSILGLPRIITDEKALDRLVKIVDSPSNGLTFCTGSFGPNSKMDLVKSIRKYSMVNTELFTAFLGILANLELYNLLSINLQHFTL